MFFVGLNLWLKKPWGHLSQQPATSSTMARLQAASSRRDTSKGASWEVIELIGLSVTPWKINMDHNHGGLEDHFPF